MRFSRRAFFVAGALFCAASSVLRADQAPVSLPSIVPAPGAIPKPQSQPNPLRKRQAHVRILNVPVRVMAWWLDPENNPAPLDFGLATQGEQPKAPAENPLKNKPFRLPEGVDRIIAIDPQNVLLIFGTEEGIRQLKDTIAFLDQPLK